MKNRASTNEADTRNDLRRNACVITGVQDSKLVRQQGKHGCAHADEKVGAQAGGAVLGLALQDYDREVSGRPERLVQGYVEAAISQSGIKEIAPRISRAAFLFNPATTPYRDIYLKPFQAAAASLALEAIAAPVHDTQELESVVAAHAREPNGSLVVMPDGFLNVHRAEIVLLAARYHVPAVYPWRFFAETGGLLTYGSVQGDMFRTAATYVDRILKGEKPADLPVQAPTKYELVVNLKTAKALGLDVPPLLQQRADEVIE